jgi:integral membrane sensor domain MASE1
VVTEGVGRWIVQAIGRTRLHVFIFAFVGHLAAARIANNWELGDRLVSPLWPAAGVSVGLTLIVGKKWWLVIVGAAIGKLVNVIVFLDITSPRQIAALLTAQTVELIVAAMVGQYLLKPPEASRDAVRTIRLVLLGSMLAAAIGAGLVATLSGFEDPSRTARDWFIGDGLGILVAAPAIYSLSIEFVRSPHNRFAGAELGVSLTLLTVITIVGFRADTPLIVLTIPLIAWLAVRFGPIA